MSFSQKRAIIALGLHSLRGTLQVAQSWLNRLYKVFLDGKSNFSTATVSETRILGIHDSNSNNKLIFQHKRTEDFFKG